MAEQEGFFKRLRDTLSEGSEPFGEQSSSSVEPADITISDSEVSDLPSFVYSPRTEDGEPEVGASYYSARGLTADEGREVPHLDVRYRQEHEPYRYEPDGDKVVWVTKAHLYEVHPLSGDAVKIHELAPLNIKVLPDCVVYAEFSVGKQGHVIADPAGQPDDSLYRLKVAETLPPIVHFELPDEDGLNGAVGHYVVPLFYFQDGELLRDHWNDEEDPPRGVQLYGGLKGHRGPYWWVRGYNTLKNIGSGKNVYKEYVKAEDAKKLRSINERGQSSVSSPFSGEAQVKVKYNAADKADADEIHVTGNEVNKHFKIGGVGVGVWEDGLLTCLSDLDCQTLTTRELSTTSVVTAASTTSVLTSGSTVSVLTSGGTTTVGANPTESNLTSVISSVGNTNVAIAPEPSDMVNVWSGGTTTNVWSGGTANAGGGLTAFKVSKCGSTTDCVWVLGIDASGSYESSAPTFPAFITGATSVSGITGASFTSVVKSLSTTSVVNSGTATNVLKDLTPVDVVTSTGTATVISSGSTTSVLSSAGTATVYKAHSSGTHKYLEAPSGSSADSEVKVVKCPTGADTCPPP